MYVFLDESGDLGFTLNQPYRAGGSSRYLTISFLLIPKDLLQLPKRIVRNIYNKRKRSAKNELKGADLNESENIFVAKKTVELLNENPQIRIFAITVYKKNVADHIREDPNKLYNYMVALALLNRIKKEKEIIFVPDARSIKVQSGNSLVEYLQTELWFKLKAKTTIVNNPQESHKYLNLQFIDFLTHIIWIKYEDRKRKSFNILAQKIGLKHLFFP